MNKLIETGCDVMVKNRSGSPAIFYVFFNEDLEIVKHMVENKKVDINYKNTNSTTSFHIASIFNKNLDVLKYLSEKKVDPYALNSRGNTILHLASEYNENLEVKKNF